MHAKLLLELGVEEQADSVNLSWRGLANFLVVFTQNVNNLGNY